MDVPKQHTKLLNVYYTYIRQRIRLLEGKRCRNRLGRQVLRPGVLASIPTEDEPLTTTRKHYPNSIK